MSDKLEEAIIKAIKATKKKSTLRKGYNRCMYRHPEGHCCVVGNMIKDEFYDHAYEGDTPAYSQSLREAIAMSIGVEDLSQPDVNILTRLQTCHDEADEDFFEKDFKASIVSLVERGSLPKYCLKAFA